MQGKKQGDVEALQIPLGSGAYPVTVQQHPANAPCPQGYVQYDHQPIPFKVIKDLKQAVVTYGMQSTYVKGLLQGLANEHRLIPFD